MGTTHADLKSSGTIPCIMDRFIICERGSAIIEAESFKKREETPSNPTALLVQRPSRYVNTFF